jgi:hypothetical protein
MTNSQGKFLSKTFLLDSHLSIFMPSSWGYPNTYLVNQAANRIAAIGCPMKSKTFPIGLFALCALLPLAFRSCINAEGKGLAALGAPQCPVLLRLRMPVYPPLQIDVAMTDREVVARRAAGPRLG